MFLFLIAKSNGVLFQNFLERKATFDHSFDKMNEVRAFLRTTTLELKFLDDEFFLTYGIEGLKTSKKTELTDQTKLQKALQELEAFFIECERNKNKCVRIPKEMWCNFFVESGARDLEKTEKIKDLEKTISQLGKKTGELSQQVHDLTARLLNDELKQENDRLRQNNERLNSENSSLKQENNRLQQEVHDLQRRISGLENPKAQKESTSLSQEQRIRNIFKSQT